LPVTATPPSVSKTLLAALMHPPETSDLQAWAAHVENAAPPAIREPLRVLTPKQILHDRGTTSTCLDWMAAFDERWQPALVACFDDRPDAASPEERRLAWRGLLRLFLLLRHLPGTVSWPTRSQLTEDDSIAPQVSIPTPDESTAGANWDCLEDIEEPFVALARALASAGAPEPEVGLDLPDPRGEAWAEGELVWERQRVGLTSRARTGRARGEPHPDWTLFLIEDLDDDPAPVLKALTDAKED